MTTRTVPIAEVLRIAVEIANSNLNPDYAEMEVVQLAAAIANNDPTELADIAERLGVYADAVGLHGLDDNPDLVDDLYRWSAEIRRIRATAAGRMTKPEQVAYLKAHGWIRVDSQGSQTWRDPDDTNSFTLAAAISCALAVDTTA